MRFAASSLLAASMFMGTMQLANVALAQAPDSATPAEPPPEDAEVSDADKERAKKLFDEGRQLLAEGSTAAACAKFKESQKVRPGVGTLYNLADCNEKLGKTGTAYGLFAEVAERSKIALRPDREQKAKERMAELEPKLMKIRLSVPNNGKGVKSITIDGELVSPEDYNKAIASDPGDHVVVAITNKDDGEPYEESVELDEAGKTVTVAIPVAPGAKMKRRVGMIVGGGITAAVGVAALGTAIWLGTSGEGDEGTGYAAVGLGILGIAGLAIGIPIFAVGFKKKPVRNADLDEAPLLEPSPIPQLAIGPTGGSLTWQF